MILSWGGRAVSDVAIKYFMHPIYSDLQFEMPDFHQKGEMLAMGVKGVRSKWVVDPIREAPLIGANH